jgi:two-component system nitrogen regulation sensor histidine kinase GlnL
MNNDLHSLLLDNLTTAVMLLDSSLRITYLNPSARMLLDSGGHRVLGLDFSLLLHEDPKSVKALREAIDFGRPFTKRQTLLQIPNSLSITVDYSVTPTEVGKQPALLIELQPMDRMLKISREETLVASQQNSRTLIRGLAHEIKNPLGGLRGAAQLLARQLNDEELKDYTTIIIEEADRLRNLVDRLLGPHRMPQAAMTNVHECLERITTLISAETDDGIHFVRDYDPSIPPLYADKEQLIQAALNIIRNAMQALEGRPDPTITLRTRVLRQFTISNIRHRLVCKVEIIDNGPGIPADLAETIFFPMVTGRADGSGLGLSIAQSILSQHQGLIECSSQAGHTEFSIYIPLEPSHEQP